MIQAILIEPGKIALRDTPVPEPSVGEIVVKVDTALTCGTDLKAYVRGHSLIPMPGPFGHEYSGTVAKAGPGITEFKEGDPVMGVHSAPCLVCRYCGRGLYHLCDRIMENKALGAFSEYLLLPSHVTAQNLFHKPAGLSFGEAALLEPLSCVIHPYGRIRWEEVETALILGAGPIGLMHLAYLKTRDIKVIVSEYVDDRRSLASEMGAHQVTSPHDVEDAVRKTTDHTGIDLVIECTGQQSAWEKSPSYVRRGGTIVLFGGCPSGTQVTYDAERLHYDELTLLGSFHFTPEDVKAAYMFLREKTVDLSMLISGRFPLKDIEKTFLRLKEGKGIKYAIGP